MAQRIAILICSTRPRRVCPAIASHVSRSLLEHQTTQKERFAIDLIDLAEQGLPLYDEPAIPAHFPAEDPTSHYAHEHTRKWSKLIQGYHGFVFVTPQYNRSVPATLKNALDFLFHEWTGKPAILVTYGSRGGDQAAQHLRDIFGGLRMKPSATGVPLRTQISLLDQIEANAGSVPMEVATEWTDAGSMDRLRQAWDELVESIAAQPSI